MDHFNEGRFGEERGSLTRSQGLFEGQLQASDAEEQVVEAKLLDALADGCAVSPQVEGGYGAYALKHAAPARTLQLALLVFQAGGKTCVKDPYHASHACNLTATTEEGTGME